MGQSKRCIYFENIRLTLKVTRYTRCLKTVMSDEHLNKLSFNGEGLFKFYYKAGKLYLNKTARRFV